MKTAGIWSLFFVLGVVLTGLIFVWRFQSLVSYSLAADPDRNNSALIDNIEDSSFLSSIGYLENSNAVALDTIYMLSDQTVLLASQSPITEVMPARNGIKKYRTKAGDTFYSLAAQFGISVQTIRAANPDLQNALGVGQTVLILPVSGILYKTRDNDSLESVASRYNITSDEIITYNPDYQKLFAGPNQAIILPGAN